MSTRPLVLRRKIREKIVEDSDSEDDDYKRLDELFLKLSIHEQWSRCRLKHIRAGPGTCLSPLLTNANTIPENFPKSVGALRLLDLQSVTTLLLLYEQPVPNSVEARRRALARFIGAPVY